MTVRAQFRDDETFNGASADAVIDPLINIAQLFRDSRTLLARPQARFANRHRVQSRHATGRVCNRHASSHARRTGLVVK